MTTVCSICGTSYVAIRNPGDRCNDESLIEGEPGADDGCVGRVISKADYDRIEKQAAARRLDTRRDLGNRPMLKRSF